jgi:Tfp pilus assembly protein PilO
MKLTGILNLKLDNKKILLIALFALFIIYIDCHFVIKMQLANLRVLNPKVAKLKKDITAFKKDFAVVNSLKVKPEQAGVNEKQVISEKDLPDLLEYISEIGNKNNVRIMQIKSSRETKTKEVKPLPGVKFILVYISLDIFSNYHNLGVFINALENGDKFIAVHELKIAPDKKDYMRQQANLTLKTYVKK